MLHVAFLGRKKKKKTSLKEKGIAPRGEDLSASLSKSQKNAPLFRKGRLQERTEMVKERGDRNPPEALLKR